MKELTRRQREVLDFITRTIEENGLPPSIREIGKKFRIKSTNGVRAILSALSHKGYIRRKPLVSRGIELLGSAPGRPRADVVQVPVFGSIAAGEPLHIPPSDSWHTPEVESVEMPGSLTKGNSDVFAVRVKGESMIDALLRGDPTAQAEVLKIERQNGIISANEWRAMKNMNPQEGEQGDVYWQPLNMADAKTIQQMDNAPSVDGEKDDEENLE